MVNQTNQNISHNCKWTGCSDKFDSMLSLWKHVEQQHVDNATPRLIHLVNDDDDIPVTTSENTTMTKSINFVATSQTNQSHNVYPAHINTGVINTIMSGTGNINNNVQNINLMTPNLNLQGVRQTTQSPLQRLNPNIMIQQTATTAYLSQNQQRYLTLSALPPQFQQIMTQPTALLQLQQQQVFQSASQANAIPLESMPKGSMPNPITIDDNNTMDVDPPVINIQRSQKKVANKQSLSQNTKK